MDTPVHTQEAGKRAIVGLLVAPAVPAVFLLCFNLAVAGGRFGWALAAISGVIAYLAALLIGVPCHLLFVRAQVKSIFAYLVVGSAIGLFGYALVFLPQILGAQPLTKEFLVEVWNGSSGWARYGAVWGAVSALAFWLIAVRSTRTRS